MKLVPCREPLPSLPKAKKPQPAPHIFTNTELFGFDTETTRCGKKELRSYQAAWQNKSGAIEGTVLYLKGWFTVERVRAADKRIKQLLGSRFSKVDWKAFDTVGKLRRACQRLHERLIYDTQPRTYVNKNGNWTRNRKRKIHRCACAYNGNFDLGVMADYTTLLPDLRSGGMEGAGVEYVFTSGDKTTNTQLFGLRIKALYLGALSVPFTFNRGELWDIASAARNLWGANGLKGVGEKVGLPKQEPDFNCPVYSYIDAVVTLYGAQQLTADLLKMDFKGQPDRFISGATASKDMLKKHYQPFFLDEEQHAMVWPAYFGGMTGPTRPELAHSMVENVVYGDLDGAYSVSGQKLEVFNWCEPYWIDAKEVKKIIAQVKKNPASFWDYGSLHIECEGVFDLCPMRVATMGDKSEKMPSASSGLVWCKMSNYRTTLTLGDFLHSKPRKVKIIRGLLATTQKGRSPDLFKMCADEREKYAKGTIENTWHKLRGNCLYGSVASRNGPKREIAGAWFNALIASSITGAIRHAMWVVNEAAGKGSFYNDTDSSMMTKEGFNKAVEALKPLGIGFSNKTSEELANCDEAAIAVIHGSKRYAMLSKEGVFGAKCHGLGSWWAWREGWEKPKPIAHQPELLRCVWSIAYPNEFGEPDMEVASIKVFHKFSIRTKKVSNLVKRYAVERFGVPLVEIATFGKAGNFGFLSPTDDNGKIKPVISYEMQEAAAISDFTLFDVAQLWAGSWDKKYNYVKMERWRFSGSDVREVEAIAHTQTLLAQTDDGTEGDISIEGGIENE